jgi:probable HAF family extracellular repeat protein
LQRRVHYLIGVLGTTLALAQAPANAAPSYTFQLLPTVNLQGIAGSSATSINNRGDVVGTLQNRAGPNFDSGVLWKADGTMVSGIGLQHANGINNAGTVAGNALLAPGAAPGRAATFGLSNTPTWRLLDFVGTGTESRANAINDAGQAAGYATTTFGGAPHAVRWDGTVATDLGTLGGSSSLGFAINASGVVAGNARISGCCVNHAAIWQADGSVTDLGLQLASFADSTAYGINDEGAAVGTAVSEWGGYYQAVVWNQGKGSVLAPLFANTTSIAYDINNKGQIVGTSGHATLWDDSVVLDLNTLLPSSVMADGWVLVDATSINDDGSIVGTAHNDRLKLESAYLLKASAAEVPEPASLALVVAGLAGVCAQRRRGIKNS